MTYRPEVKKAIIFS